AAALVAFLALAALAALDLSTDLRAGTTVGHVVTEGALIALALAGVIVAGHRFAALRQESRAAREHVAELASRLEATRLEAERWRADAHDALRGLGAAIDRQLDRWGLTSAEKEVA